MHVEKGEGEAKLWLQPVQLLRRVRELTFQHQAVFVERWNEHFRG